MDKQNVEESYNETLLSNKKESITAKCYDMKNLKTSCQVIEIRHEMPHIAWCHLCGMSRKGKSAEETDYISARLE